MNLNTLLKSTICFLSFSGIFCANAVVADNAVVAGNAPDVFTGASTKSHFKENSLTGKSLQQVINSHDAAFVLSTVNPDNSPNAAVFIPAMASDSEIKFGLAENQSRKNIERTKRAVLTVYRYLPKESRENRHQGARLILELDEKQSVDKTTHKMLIMKIRQILPLG